MGEPANPLERSQVRALGTHPGQAGTRTCRVAPISRRSGWFEPGKAWRKGDD